MNFSRNDLTGMKVTVMGLGLHGGGLASALYCARYGADITVTDLRSEKELAPSIEQLSGFPVRFVLGKHEEKDFSGADLVIKNPGVPRSSSLLKLCPAWETDISLFLRFASSSILAVTGTKGKSTVVSALHHILKLHRPDTRLGGNITVSPLTFLDDIADVDNPPPVVLELSSWQLADLKGRGLLHPEVSTITNIMRDHLNRYNSMEEYVDDKCAIFREQKPSQASLFLKGSPWSRQFADESPAEILYYSDHRLEPEEMGGWLEPSGEGKIRLHSGEEFIVPADVALPGAHNRMNLLCAGIMAATYGVSPETVLRGCASFTGIAHRMEYVLEKEGVSFYNDSAATIPDAVLEGVRSFPGGCVLITGGTDKNLEFDIYTEIGKEAEAVILIDGSATRFIEKVLTENDIPFLGPFRDLEELCIKAFGQASPGKTVLFSPGCASFELFANEFDRGDRFKQTVRDLFG